MQLGWRIINLEKTWKIQSTRSQKEENIVIYEKRFRRILFRSSVEEVKDALKLAVNGPGKLLGCRAMQKKLRQEHDLKVPRDLVVSRQA